MKVLQFCHKPPFPDRDGGCLAINQMTKALEMAGIEVKVLAISTPKHPYIESAFPEGYIAQYTFETLFVDTTLNIVDAFSALVTQDSYNISRFFSTDVDKALVTILESENPDIVLMESLFVAPYLGTIRRCTPAPVVLRSHNLEYSIWHRLTRTQKTGLKKTYLRILTWQLKAFETKTMGEIDGLIAINSDELAHSKRLGYTGTGITIPFGIDPTIYEPDHSNLEFPSIFHLGSMDWQPNQEGLKWFLNDIWPMVVAKRPDLKMYVAGREMPDWVFSYESKNVHVIGEVTDAKYFMKSKGILVIPLLSGGGMRVKMIEALALEKPVVTTPLGAKGVKVKNGKEAILARTKEDFAQGIIQLSDDKQAAMSMGKLGRKLVENSYNNKVLSDHLAIYLSRLLK